MAHRDGAVENVGLSSDYWRGRRVLVTGHTGFKGAWLSLWLEKLGATVVGLALEAESPDGAYNELQPSLESHVVDLRDATSVGAIVEASDPDIVFHLAAQSLVRESYADPRSTYEVNIMGTLNLLAALPRAPSLRAVVVTTTDKVYRNIGAGRAFVEDDPLGGFDIYSSSKACVEILVESWLQSFMDDTRVAVHTVRAGNVIGGGDHSRDRLVPDVFRALAGNQNLLLRYPEAVRPWQFVLEPLSAYLSLAEAGAVDPGRLPRAFNFGPASDSWVPVAEVADRLFALWGSGAWELTGESHPKESSILKLDSSRAEALLGWKSKLDLDTALRWTVEWWRAQIEGDDVRSMSLDQIDRFERLESHAE